MRKDKIYEGQFVWHDGIAKIVRFGRPDVSKDNFFGEWTDKESGDICHCIMKPSEMSPYKSEKYPEMF